MHTLQAQNGNWHPNNEQGTSITLMSCLAYSPPCHSAEVHSLSWYTVLREGSGIQAGRQPRQMKAPEFIEHDTAPFPSLASTSKYIFTNAKSRVLRLPQISLPVPLILLSFHATSHQLEECGHRQVVLALGDLLRRADSKATEEVFPDFMVQIARLLHAGLSSVYLIPLLTDRAARKSSQKWSQTVPNSDLKRCRSATAPALSSSRTSFYLLEIFWQTVTGWWVPTCFCAALALLGDAVECKLLQWQLLQALFGLVKFPY